MLPPLTDFVALLGVNLALCAALLRLPLCRRLPLTAARWLVLGLLLVLWLPLGLSGIPVAGYLRGIVSDLSITLVALSCWSLQSSLFAARLPELDHKSDPKLDLKLDLQFESERRALYSVLAVTAILLYPTALGWGNWDAYRLGWGSPSMLLGLLLICLLSGFAGLRLLPALIALALLAWAAGLMESNNLWDYLLDPWLAVFSLAHCLKRGIKFIFTQAKRQPNKRRLEKLS